MMRGIHAAAGATLVGEAGHATRPTRPARRRPGGTRRPRQVR